MKYIYIFFIISLSFFIYQHIQYYDVGKWEIAVITKKRDRSSHSSTDYRVMQDGSLHKPSSSTSVKIYYEYKVNGITYSGTNYTPDHDSVKWQPLVNINSEFNVVYHHPHKHDLSVLIPKSYIGTKWLIAMGVFGTIILGHIIRILTNEEEKS